MIVTDRRDWRVSASAGLRTSVALVFTWFKVLSGVVVWVVRSRVPKIWWASGVVSHQFLRSVSPCVSATCCLPLR